MESINKIELRGRVGSVKIQNFDSATVANFSLATVFLSKDRNGNVVVEVTWHNITAWEGKATSHETLMALKKGCCAYVKGRTRMRRYTDQEGRDLVTYDVIASLVEIVE